MGEFASGAVGRGAENFRRIFDYFVAGDETVDCFGCMRVRGLAGILLVMGAIGGALAVFGGKERRDAWDARTSEGAADASVGEVIWKAERESREIQNHALAARELAATARVVEATEEENAALAETIQLQQMAEGTGLELAPEQWAALAEVTRRMQVWRGVVEAEIGAVQVVAPGRWRMDVPGYVEMGAGMRARFFGEIGDVLGARVAADVIDKLGAEFEGYFAGFGVSLQTLDISGDQRGSDEGWQVTRTIAYSKNVTSGEQVTVRRETYFVGREDPVVVRVRG